ncbi:MAG: hypothetical protein QE493_05590 [Verrucomicrobiae bacterium]|nr:hypothetical protein [Verrucomicrobiae bacterium]
MLTPTRLALSGLPKGCLPAVSLAVPRPPVVPHQPSQLPRHDQYKTSGLTSSQPLVLYYESLSRPRPSLVACLIVNPDISH